MGFLERFTAVLSYAIELHLRRYGATWIMGCIAAAALGACAYLLIAPPRPFPTGVVIIMKEGETGQQLAQALGEAQVIREPRLLDLYLKASGKGALIRSGAYRFDEPISLPRVAWRLTHGIFGIPPVTITFAEGATVLDMARKISKALPEISQADFISLAMPYEGYLFPDTYSFQPSASANTVVTDMRRTFTEKTAPLAGDIAASGHSLSDIIIMASIVEREAARPEDKRMVAGILWNRVAKGMPLQVDAVFGYIYSRATYSPSYTDLGVDSPYNTYSHAGLPPGPISNPGLDSIEAAIHPAKTNYLYYLTGRDGLMHYATTYAGHKANLATYLK